MDELNNLGFKDITQENFVLASPKGNNLAFEDLSKFNRHVMKQFPDLKFSSPVRTSSDYIRVYFLLPQDDQLSHLGHLSRQRFVHQNEIELLQNKIFAYYLKSHYGVIKNNHEEEFAKHNFEALLKKHIQMSIEELEYELKIDKTHLVERLLQKLILKSCPQPNPYIGFRDIVYPIYPSKSKDKRHVFLSVATRLKSYAQDFVSAISEKLHKAEPELLQTPYVIEVNPKSSPEDYESELRANKWMCLNIERNRFSLENAINWTQQARNLGRKIGVIPIKQVVIANAKEISHKELAKARIEFPKSSALFIKYSGDDNFKKAFEKFADEIRDAHESALKLR